MLPRAVRNKKAREKYAANREQEIARSSAWNKNNKSRVNENAVKRRSSKPIEFVLYWNARNRAKAKALPFDIEISDILVPKFCPVLGIELIVGTKFARPNSPSLDRISPARGYVKGNIAVVSHKANTMKSDATIEELENLLRYMKENTNVA